MKNTKFLCASLATALGLTGLPLSAGAATVSPKAPLAARSAPKASTRAPEPAPKTTRSERAPAGRSFSSERRDRYAERDQKDKKSDEYKGGDGIYIGGGVLIVALVVVLVIVLID